MAELYEGMAMGDRPSNATSTEQEGFERSSVNYYGNATGYLAYPKNGTDLPAVIMIHEWWGLNQNIKNMAEQLANEGYAVLAVDLYDGEVATESSRASELAGSVRNNPDEAIHNLNAAVEHVASLQTVNSSKIASLGWCFGGGQSLQLALNTERPLAATVIYYGTLVTNQTELAEITWPVLGIFGAEDQSIPVDTVNQFKAALDANAVTNEIYIYDGVGHAFANPSGGNYAPEETTDAWDKTLAFLRNYV
jgi:carboxymethylenebutenolidase